VSLTSGRGPLGLDPAGTFDPPLTGPVTYVEPYQRRVRGMKDGAAVVDSERAVFVHRPGRQPRWAFPAEDVHVDSEPEPAAPGHVTVAWDAVDRWLEEEQEVVDHPRNPYHRVDCLPTTRRLRAELGGVTLVDTDDTTGVFETGLAPRLYVARQHVRMDLLRPSDTRTYCPYKGWCSYFSADGVDDVAWSYEHPLSESAPIAGLVAFDPTKATVEQALAQS
jgi:uncharacterized protein (DUF427 family)